MEDHDYGESKGGASGADGSDPFSQCINMTLENQQNNSYSAVIADAAQHEHWMQVSAAADSPQTGEGCLCPANGTSMK